MSTRSRLIIKLVLSIVVISNSSNTIVTLYTDDHVVGMGEGGSERGSVLVCTVVFVTSTGDDVGDSIDEVEGDTVGDMVGDCVRLVVGDVGSDIVGVAGDSVGDNVGLTIGDSVGDIVGEDVGAAVRAVEVGGVVEGARLSTHLPHSAHTEYALC